MDIICGIYVIENKVNGKKYVGQSVNILLEWRVNHKNPLLRDKHHNIHLQRAWNKYGESNFEHKIIHVCSEEELTNLEIFYIKELNAHQTLGGYNISWGGDAPMRNRKHSPEAKEKIRLSHPDISGENNPMFGKKHSEEWRNNHRLFSLGRKHSEETKEKISLNHADFSGENNPNFGRKRKNSTSKYYGVTTKPSGKYSYWESSVRVNKKSVKLGTFKLEEDAARAYDKYVVENNLPNPLNFPEEHRG